MNSHDSPVYIIRAEEGSVMAACRAAPARSQGQCPYRLLYIIEAISTKQ